MKQLILIPCKIALTILLLLSCIIPADAAEYGKNKTAMPYCYQVLKGQSVKVRTKPNTSTGQRIFSVNSLDYIYIDDEKTFEGSGYTWISISGDQGFIATKFLQKINNPYYNTYVEKVVESPSLDLRKTHDYAKIILLILTLGALSYGLFTRRFKRIVNTFWGVNDDNNMKKLFFFNPQPYTAVLQVSGYIAGSLIGSVITLLGVGLLVFLLLWLIKALLVILVWVGIIGCVVGILACLFGAWACIVLVLIGGWIWSCSDGIEEFGQSLVDWGMAFFNDLNMINFAADIFLNNWQYGLAIVLLPISFFVILALISLLFVGSVMLIEGIVTFRYNIKHPCPRCHEPSEPAYYLSEGVRLPVKLRPGRFGLFKIKHPDTGEQMPTMLFNGRDKLTRECPRCGNYIKAKVGQEKHITMVGLPQAGKTTLIYRIIAEMIREAGQQNIEFTDSIKPEIKRTITSIVETGEMVDFPKKTAVERHNSIQLLVHRSGLALPYRLYINDVAGELFTSKDADSLDKVPFFSNTQSVLVLLDPYTTYFGNLDVSRQFEAWYHKNVGDIKQKFEVNSIHSSTGVKIDIDDAFTSLKNIIENKGRKTKNIHLNLVLVKKDTGYLKGVDTNSTADIRSFVVNDWDMANYISNIENDYASVSYYAVSAIEDINKSNVKKLYKDVLVQIDLKL